MDNFERNIKIFGVIMILILGAWFTFSIIDENKDIFFSNDSLTSNDVTLSSETGLTSVYAKITPFVEIKWIEINLEIRNSKDEIIHYENKKFYSLSKNQTYKFEFPLSISLLVNGNTYNFKYVDGKK